MSVSISQVPVTISGGGILNVTGPIVGSFNLVKTGDGKLVLQGVSTSFTGATAIAGGALIVNGNSQSSPHNLTGGVLGGSGTVGPVTATGGAIAPGDATPGLLTVNGALTMSANVGVLVGHRQHHTRHRVRRAACVVDGEPGRSGAQRLGHRFGSGQPAVPDPRQPERESDPGDLQRPG